MEDTFNGRNQTADLVETSKGWEAKLDASTQARFDSNGKRARVRHAGLGANMRLTKLD